MRKPKTTTATRKKGVAGPSARKAHRPEEVRSGPFSKKTSTQNPSQPFQLELLDVEPLVSGEGFDEVFIGHRYALLFKARLEVAQDKPTLMLGVDMVEGEREPVETAETFADLCIIMSSDVDWAPTGHGLIVEAAVVVGRLRDDLMDSESRRKILAGMTKLRELIVEAFAIAAKSARAGLDPEIAKRIADEVPSAEDMSLSIAVRDSPGVEALIP